MKKIILLLCVTFALFGCSTPMDMVQGTKISSEQLKEMTYVYH